MQAENVGNKQEGFRISPQQAVAWEQASGNGALQSVYRARLIGEFEEGRLREILTALVKEREILRTSLVLPAGAPEAVQVVRSGDSEKSFWVEATEDCAQLLLSAGSEPSFRAQLAPQSDGSSLFTLWSSPTISDWRGLQNLADTCLRRYVGLPDREDEPLEYADVAEWLRGLQEGEDAEEAIAYWKKQSISEEPWPRLSVDWKPSEYSPGAEASTIDGKLLESLRSFVSSERPAAAVLLSCWQGLLWRLTDDASFQLMVACDGRGYEGLDVALGPFRTTCPLMAKIEAADVLTGVSERVAADLSQLNEAQEAFSWQHVSGGDALRQRRGSRWGLGSHVGFEFIELPTSSGSEGRAWTSEPVREATEPCLVRLVCSADAGLDRLELGVQYDASQLDAAQARRLLGEFETFLRSALEAPSTAFGKLEIVPSEERQALLSFAREAAPFDESLTATAWFERVVDQNPEAPALLALGAAAHTNAGPETVEQVSYRRLDALANRVAHRLAKAGVVQGDLVALCFPRSVGMVAAMLGVQKLGAAYVPLDPEYPRARTKFILEDVSAKALLADGLVANGLPEHSSQPILIDDIISDEHLSEARPSVQVKPEDVAYLIYTSGSTGKPKGVEILHRNLVHSTDARHRYYRGENKRFLLLSSYAFDSSVAGVFGTLLGGSALVLPEEGVQRDLARIGEIIETQGVTDLLWLPSAYDRLLVEQGTRLKSVQRAVVAGEACRPELIQKHRATLPGAELHNEYGPTEATVWTTVYDTAAYVSGEVPIGLPITRARVIAINPEGRLAPFGVSGELCISGAGLARGYHGRPELTQERFVELEGARFYRSGDTGSIAPDGTVLFQGRNDSQVKINGYRIELGEIETAFTAHPRIAEAVVEARVRPGGSDKQLVAYLTTQSSPTNGSPTDSSPVRLAELRGFVLERLPNYMLPAHIELLSEFPRLPNGKIDRSKLPEPGHTAKAEVSSGDMTRPRSPVEEVMMDIWAQVLGIDQPKVNDNFFSLGGDSLNGLQVVDLANKRGLSITPAHLFQHPILSDLAASAETRKVVGLPGSSAQTLVNLQPRGEKTPLFLIHSVPGDLLHYGHLVHHMGQDRPIFGFQALGLSDLAETHTRLPSMAYHYVKVLTEFQPEGPYHLAGWCFGGTVAIEMAHILRAQGKSVGLLGMLEAEPWQPQTLVTRAYQFRSLVKKGMKAVNYARAKLKHKLAGGPPGDGADQFSLEFNQGPFRNRAHVYRANMQAQVGHVTRPLPEHVVLFKSETREEDRLVGDDYEWSRYVSSVESYVIPGTHDAILRGDNARYLAEILRDCLERADGQASN